MENKEVILPDDEKAARLTTVTGWVSRTGRFWGNDERMARYEGSTHSKCSCGAIIERPYLKCEPCRTIKEMEDYYKMPFKEWNGEGMLYDAYTDQYFSDGEEQEYYEDEGLDIKDARFIICDPNYLSQIDYDLWNDDLAEDQELPKQLVELVDKVNEYCRNAKPISWAPGKYRTEIKIDQTIE